MLMSLQNVFYGHPAACVILPAKEDRGPDSQPPRGVKCGFVENGLLTVIY